MKINWSGISPLSISRGGGGGGVQNEKPSVVGVWIFSGTAHFLLTCKYM